MYGDHLGAHWAPFGLALSPDGAMLVTASEDATIGLWDANTLHALGALTGHEGPVGWVAVTPSGKQLLSTGDDATVRLWDLEDRREVRKFTGHIGPVRCVAAMPDGRRRFPAATTPRSVSGTLPPAKNCEFDKHTRTVWKVCLTADGQRVLSGSDDRTMRLWDLESGEDVVEFENDRPGPTQYRAIALSPDGSRAACGWSEGEQHFATMHCSTPPAEKKFSRSPGDVTHHGHGMDGISHPGSQAFSPDGSLLLSGAWSRPTATRCCCGTGTSAG